MITQQQIIYQLKSIQQLDTLSDKIQDMFQCDENVLDKVISDLVENLLDMIGIPDESNLYCRYSFWDILFNLDEDEDLNELAQTLLNESCLAKLEG